MVATPTAPWPTEVGIALHTAHRRTRGKALTFQQELENKVIASLRAIVEFPFRVVKRQWGHAMVRYRGLAKNTAQFYTLFALANLYQVRHQLLYRQRYPASCRSKAGPENLANEANQTPNRACSCVSRLPIDPKP